MACLQFAICTIRLKTRMKQKNARQSCQMKLNAKHSSVWVPLLPSLSHTPPLPDYMPGSMVLVLFVAIVVVVFVVAVLRVNAQRFHLTVCVIWGHAPILPISQYVAAAAFASAAAFVFAFAWRLAVQVN